MTNIEIINLIHKLNIESGYKNSVHEFTHGKCLIFAMMLKEYLPLGTVMYIPDDYHFIFRYNGNYYDATGNVTKRYRFAKQMSLAEFIRRNKLVKMFKIA